MKRLIAIAALALGLSVPAQAAAPPNTTDLFIVTGEGFQVTATWRSTEPSKFHCWLTGKARKPCTPPHYINGLAPGTYTFNVRAFGIESGLKDPTPARATFRIAP